MTRTTLIVVPPFNESRMDGLAVLEARIDHILKAALAPDIRLLDPATKFGCPRRL